MVHAKILKFHKISGHVTLANLYFVYAAMSLAFSLHGIFIIFKWRKMQLDGNRMIMHVRTVSILGAGSCAIALWLAIATLSAFGLVEVHLILSLDINLIYLVTLILVTVHLVISPWLLCTIHRKASQADDIFGAEFLSDIRHPRKHHEDYDDDAICSITDDHEGIFGAESNSNCSHLQLAMDGDDDKKLHRTCRQQSLLVVSPGMLITSNGAVLAKQPHLQKFSMASKADLSPSDFWRLWKQTETTGAFSCTFANQPSQSDIQHHLEVHGFRVVAAEQKDCVLHVYFYGSQDETDVVFLCEFVLLLARRFFQAIFKCKNQETASDFVSRFNLQDVLVVEGE